MREALKDYVSSRVATYQMIDDIRAASQEAERSLVLQAKAWSAATSALAHPDTRPGTNLLLAVRVDRNPDPSIYAVGGTDLVYLDPAAPFLSSLHLAFFAGILLAAPFIFFRRKGWLR